MTTYRRLDPAPGEATAAELLAEVRPAERAGARRPFVYLSMVATVDGRAALGASSDHMGGEADLEMLLELRTVADAVLIGSGTLRAEGYDRLVRSPQRRERRVAAGLAPDPVAVLVSRGLDLPWDAGLFLAPEQPVLVYTAAAASGAPPPVPAPVEVVRLPEPTPAAALADLRRRGVRAVMCEGGPTLNGLLLADGLADELFLTVTPLVTAEPGAPRIVEGGGLPGLVRPRPLWVLRAGDELFLRYAL